MHLDGEGKQGKGAGSEGDDKGGNGKQPAMSKEEKDKLKPDLPIAVKISPDIENKSIEDICDILANHSIDLLIISTASSTSI